MDKLLVKRGRLPGQRLIALGVLGEQVRDTRRDLIGGCGVKVRVEAATAVWTALRSEPMVAKSVAADVIISGAAIT